MISLLKDSYDAIVVGGGPAGCLSALRLSEKGHSVLLLEKDREFGVPVRCAELVGSKGFSLAIEPKKEWITHIAHGVTFVSPSGIPVAVPTPEPAWMLDRARMENDMARMAADKGADLLVRATASALLFNSEGKINGLTVMHPEGIRDFKCRLIIAADGVESRMAKLAGINSAITDLNDIGICAQYLVSGIKSDNGFPELHFGKNILPDCYAWMFPKGNGLANLGLGIRTVSAKNESPVEVLNRFIKLRFPGVKPLRLTIGSVPLGMYLRKLITDNFMVVGDAARMANCLDGGGITFALNSASIAAKVASDALSNGDTSLKALSPYEKEWQNGIGKQQERTFKLKNAVLKVTDDTIEKAAKSLIKKKFEDLEYMDLLKTTIFNQPSLILEAIKLFKS
ncbi:MAG: NAD(P)/FAD-dependent oxidoreductase [Fibrobacteres bacterium]|nr:NAD(P)/FAD-dependent oxidoreductase [Fibrobacterota bacterium]